MNREDKPISIGRFYLPFNTSYNLINMTLWKDIVGHGWAVSNLSSAIKHNRLVHAYLISGPTQVGKSTLALTFAQALNCLAPSAVDRPCGKCRACILIGDHRHPDVIEIRGQLGQRGKSTLKIGQLREIQQALSLTSTEGRYKIALISNFDEANPNAANMFLKTLEEPPSYAVLILTAVDPDLLLPTIPSRCQQVALRPVPAPVIQEALRERWNVDLEHAREIAHLADGRIGWAIEAVQDATLLEEWTDRLVLLHETLALTRVGRFKFAALISRDPEELFILLRTWLVWWRDLALFLIGEGQDTHTVNLDERERLSRLAGQWQAADILKSLRKTDEALWQLERNANTRLVVENLMLVYPYDLFESGS
ncbi:MAG TPA: DNA polymerase III subunit [candidate division Zixibacteria bacterium]|nr:DNA polymerase III subunit [candidate division Zixibacteria bacterium]